MSKYKSIAILDVPREILKKNKMTVFDISPIWRWLWCQLVRIDIAVDFFDLQFESTDHLYPASKEYDLILVHIDHYIPEWLPVILSELKNFNQKIKIFFCGYLPTFFPDKILKKFPEVDMILEGPLELSLTGFCQKLYCDVNSNLLSDTKCYSYPVEGNLSESQKIEYKKNFILSSVGMIHSSSGCPRKCAFCRYSEFYHKFYPDIYKQYIISEVIDEIEKISKDYNIEYIRLSDSNFLGSGRLVDQRAREFTDALKTKDIYIEFAMHCRSDCITESVINLLAEVGLKYVSIGIESMSLSQLERYQKNETVNDHLEAVKILKRNGISIQGYAILADPLVTRGELLENLWGLYQLSKDIQIVIHEKMTLYTTTNYYRKKQNIIQNMQPVDDSFGVVMTYDFVDEWCNQYYNYVEDLSVWSYNLILKKYNEIKKQLNKNRREEYIKKATEYRLKALIEIVNKDVPDSKMIEENKKQLIDKIDNLR